MIISTTKPPIANRLEKVFGVKWDDGIAIAVGDTVYSKNTLSPDVAVHEQVHINQQKKYGVEKWWNRYFDDAQFRLEQEVEAYQIQARFIKSAINDRNKRFIFIHKICKDLSGTMYKFQISYAEVWKLLKCF